jgi:hypothetical protein
MPSSRKTLARQPMRRCDMEIAPAPSHDHLAVYCLGDYDLPIQHRQQAKLAHASQVDQWRGIGNDNAHALSSSRSSSGVSAKIDTRREHR